MNRYEKHLAVLRGLPIKCIGRAADLLWLQFGELRPRCVPGDPHDTVGEWAVHIQCAWRFSHGERIVLGKSDLYVQAEADERYDWDSGGESRFDRIAPTLNEAFMTGAVPVTAILVDEVGGFSITFSSGLCLSAFPDDSGGSAYSEHYRIFQPDRDGVHFVVPTGGAA